MVFGTFDIVHPGHLYLFKKAKEYGDHLIVCVARDSTVVRVKGQQPFYTEGQRKIFLEHIRDVDRVILGDEHNPYTIIRKIKPQVIALGYDQKIFVDKLVDELTNANIQAQIVRIPAMQEPNVHSQKLKKYIDQVM